mmetsp:Transcript_17271/g.31841  ORF Transcript_17271/g.31841 Transcript_17271/m.31841 type:complete len:155 (-) Transcript_17271:39-503(-)
MGVRTTMLACSALACLLCTAAAGSHAGTHAGQRQKWWPFTSWSSSSSAAASKPVLRASAAPQKQLEETKHTLISSAVFRRKTEFLCSEANDSERAACMTAASERLFCAMFRRHSDRFQGMAGATEQKQKCSETNIMETSLEAAKDAAALMPDTD